MANKVKVIITDDQQTVKVPTGIRMLVRRACTAVLVNENFPHPAEISVRFVETDEIQRLNREHRSKDDITDVLSFPLGQDGNYDINHATGAALLGDIVICLQRAQEQSKIYSHTFQREMAFLTVHSMLHLLGYDHTAGGLDSVRMRENEEQVLVQLGLPRGYSYMQE